jgi:hypothetical protein
MSIDDFSELTIAPMINNLAGKVALDIMTGSEGGVCNFVRMLMVVVSISSLLLLISSLMPMLS